MLLSSSLSGPLDSSNLLPLPRHKRLHHLASLLRPSPCSQFNQIPQMLRAPAHASARWDARAGGSSGLGSPKQSTRTQSPSAAYKPAPEVILPPEPVPFTPRNDDGAQAVPSYKAIKPVPATCVLCWQQVCGAVLHRVHILSSATSMLAAGLESFGWIHGPDIRLHVTLVCDGIRSVETG